MGKSTYEEKSLEYERRSSWATVLGSIANAVGVIISVITLGVTGVTLVATVVALEGSRWEVFKDCIRHPLRCTATLEIALKKKSPEDQGATTSPSQPPVSTTVMTPDKPILENQRPQPTAKTEDDKVYVYTGQAYPICGEPGWRVYPAQITAAGQWFFSKPSLDDPGPKYLNVGETVTIGRCRLMLDSVEPPNSSRSESLLIFFKTAL